MKRHVPLQKKNAHQLHFSFIHLGEIRSASTRKPHNAKEREVVNTRITAVPVVLCFLHYCTEFGMDNEQEGVCFCTSLRVDIRFRGKDAAAEESRPAEEKQETVTA